MGRLYFSLWSHPLLHIEKGGELIPPYKPITSRRHISKYHNIANFRPMNFEETSPFSPQQVANF